MRWPVVLAILAVILLTYNMIVTHVLPQNLGQSTFIGLTVVTDWVSLFLLIVFGLDLTINIYLSFLSNRDSRFM